jgi:hypothetical protein
MPSCVVFEDVYRDDDGRYVVKMGEVKQSEDGMEPLGLNLGPTALEPDDYLIAPLSVRSRDDAHERRFQLNHSFSSPLHFELGGPGKDDSNGRALQRTFPVFLDVDFWLMMGVEIPLGAVETVG